MTRSLTALPSVELEPLPAGSGPDLVRLRHKTPKLTAKELAILLRLEGRPWPSAEALADEIGQPIEAAQQILHRFRQSGLCRLVTIARNPNVCECVAYLQLCLVETSAIEALDRRLEADLHVMAAVRLSGEQDYRIEAHHSDVGRAGHWFRQLLMEPAVSQGALLVTRTVFTRRPAFRIEAGKASRVMFTPRR